ncbi:hypothetical protein F4779DRAFT_21749 [Xylariaceae sp. FL0662B]|nr:hypothetical protein F4779DRAFT_21749 [Xylariaceae sp. FL0662B]
MASSINGNGHTSIQLTRGLTLGLADIRVEKGQVLKLPLAISPNSNYIYLLETLYCLSMVATPLVSLALPSTKSALQSENSGGTRYIGLIDGTPANSGVTLVIDGYPSFLAEKLSKDTNSDIVQTPDDTFT